MAIDNFKSMDNCCVFTVYIGYLAIRWEVIISILLMISDYQYATL